MVESSAAALLQTLSRLFACLAATETSVTMAANTIEERINRLHSTGVIDMHFDLPMDLYEKRNQPNVLATEFLPEFEAGGMRIIGAAIYIEDRYLPERVLQ